VSTVKGLIEKVNYL